MYPPRSPNEGLMTRPADTFSRLLRPLQGLLLASLLTAYGCDTSAGDDDDSSGVLLFGEDPSFDHPATWLYAHFDTANNAELALVLRAMETSIDSSVDFTSDELIDRSPALDPLTADDLSGLERPDADPALCQAVTLVARSAHVIDRHAAGAAQIDQSSGDPSTPDHHERTFTDGTELCWPGRTCPALRAEDTMTRVNPLFTITMSERVDYRWVDLSLPSPSSVRLDEEASNEAPPRWAIMMRSWLPETAGNETGTAAFEQAYNLGIWLSQSADPLLPVTRYTASWTQTQLPVPLDESTVRQLTRGAIADAYEAQEDWLGTLP